jgi:hypothetical protein
MHDDLIAELGELLPLLTPDELAEAEGLLEGLQQSAFVREMPDDVLDAMLAAMDQRLTERGIDPDDWRRAGQVCFTAEQLLPLIPDPLREKLTSAIAAGFWTPAPTTP